MKKLFLPACIIVLTFTVFIPSLENGFTNWDDPAYVTENVDITGLSTHNLQRIFTTTVTGTYSPLVLLTFAAEYAVAGLHPFIYHLNNLLLHVINTLLVFWFIILVSRNRAVAAITALFFGIHPLHVESVAWVTERKDLLYGLFLLSSLIAYFYYREKHRSFYYVLSLLSLVFSMMAKPQALLYPVILLGIDFFHFRKINKKIVVEKIPYLVCALLFFGITLFDNRVKLEISIESVFLHIADASYAAFWYLYKIMIPIKLACAYPLPSQCSDTVRLVHMASPFLLAGIAGAVLYSRKCTHTILFGAVFFILTLAPTLFAGTLSPSIVYDRYTYIPSIGIFFLVAHGGYRLFLKGHKAIRMSLIAFLVIAMCTMSVLTWNRCKVWKDGHSLWTDVLRKYPNVSVAYNNLGSIFSKEGNIEKGNEYFIESLRINPKNENAWYNYGMCLEKTGNFQKAADCYREALRINEHYPDAHNNLGALLSVAGNSDEAIAHYLKAITLNSRHYRARNNLGIAFFEKGRFQDAIRQYAIALSINPNFTDAHNNLAAVFATQGNFNEAVNHFNQSLRINPNNPITHYNFGILLEENSRYADALKHYQEALLLQPDFEAAAANLIVYLFSRSKNVLLAPAFSSERFIENIFFSSYFSIFLHFHASIFFMMMHGVDGVFGNGKEFTEAKEPKAQVSALS